jgi:hypothetical protein
MNWPKLGRRCCLFDDTFVAKGFLSQAAIATPVPGRVSTSGMNTGNNCSVHPQQTYAVLTLEKIMKKLVLAATISLAATTAFAGGMEEPIMEPAVVETQTSSSSGGVVVALLLLLVIAAAASN